MPLVNQYLSKAKAEYAAATEGLSSPSARADWQTSAQTAGLIAIAQEVRGLTAELERVRKDFKPVAEATLHLSRLPRPTPDAKTSLRLRLKKLFV